MEAVATVRRGAEYQLGRGQVPLDVCRSRGRAISGENSAVPRAIDRDPTNPIELESRVAGPQRADLDALAQGRIAELDLGGRYRLGGLLGKGFTQGSQKRLAFLPEQHTDFIYAVIGEELGFVGAGAVLVMFGLILWRLARLAEKAPDPFAGIVVFGIFGAWLTHILVNVGMNVGVMPITGIPLPFLSYGGSFLLATFIALGIAQRVASE